MDFAWGPRLPHSVRPPFISFCLVRSRFLMDVDGQFIIISIIVKVLKNQTTLGLVCSPSPPQASLFLLQGGRWGRYQGSEARGRTQVYLGISWPDMQLDSCARPLSAICPWTSPDCTCVQCRASQMTASPTQNSPSNHRDKGPWTTHCLCHNHQLIILHNYGSTVNTEDHC